MKLTETEIRDAYYLLRAMHDGACPKCGNTSNPSEFEWTNGGVYKGLCCPVCGYYISHAEIEGIKKLTGVTLRRRLESFVKSRSAFAAIGLGASVEIGE